MADNLRIAVIGGGPAGCAAAVQLKRFGYDVEIFEKNRIGGLLENAWKVENYLGFPDGISGKSLCKLIHQHITALNIPIISENVVSIDKQEKFIIQTDYNSYCYNIAIVATGTAATQLGNIPGNCSDRVFSEVKDMPEISNCKIGIIGAGDAAFDYAMSLSANNQVEILNRTDKVKAIKSLVEQTKSIENIEYTEKIELFKINRKFNKLLLICNMLAGEIEKEYDYLLIAIGRKPIKPIISERANESKKLFLIGDLASQSGIRQSSIAVGDGIELAMRIHLNNWKGYENHC